MFGRDISPSRLSRVAVSGIALATAYAPAGPGPLRTIALTGQIAPGAPSGQTYSAFSLLGAAAPLLNEAGHVAFMAELTGAGVTAANDRGIWSDAGGALRLIARDGDQAPGASPGQAHHFDFGTHTLRFNNQGHVAFVGRIAGAGVTADNSRAIWTDRDGDLSMAARAGWQAPNTPSGQVYASLNQDFSFTHADRIAFISSLSGPGITSANGAAIFSDRSGQMSMVVRSGEVASGQPGGGTLPYLGFTNLMMNSQGSMVFLSTTQAFPSNQTGVYTDRFGAVELLSASTNELALPAINEVGDITFRYRQPNALPGGISTTHLRFAPHTGGPVLGVANLPPSPPSFPLSTGVSLQPSSMNRHGDIAFPVVYNHFTPPASNNFRLGLAMQINGSGVLVALSGHAAPGAGPGVTFGDFSSVNFSLNDERLLVFSTQVTGTGVTSANDLGLWLADPTGAISLLLRTGDILDVNDDPSITDMRTLAGFGFLGDYGRRDGGSSAFNSAGELALLATFTDGSQGVFVMTVPAPAALCLLPLMAMRGLRRQRRCYEHLLSV